MRAVIFSVNTRIQICRLPLASPIEKRGEMSNRTENYANAETLTTQVILG